MTGGHVMSLLPLLEIRSVCKCHKGRERIFRAGIERLELWPGEALGITGPSGCGKSTLLELLALLIRPTTAETFVLRAFGRRYDLATLWEDDPRRLAAVRRAYMGFVHQGGGLYPFLTVQENIALPLRLNGAGFPSGAAQRVDELLELLRLGHVACGLPETLSYGERQRAAVARALAHRPRLVLADEPTSALDPDAARNTMDLLLGGARHSEAALLVVSHDHALLAAARIPTLAMRMTPETEENRLHYTLASTRTARSVRPAQDLGPASGRSSAITRSREQAVPRRGSLLCLLAWKDFRHERALSLCAVLAFAAALTPLMVLGGLRTGIIDTLSQRLLDNPAALAVNPYGSRRYSEEDIAALRELPSVAFIVPQTRTLASTVHVLRPEQPPVSADVLPTAPGDPLLTRYASVPHGDDAVITQELARSLADASGGRTLTLIISRRFQGRPEEVRCQVRLHAVLPDAADWKARVYLSSSLLLDMERYRDGFAVPERGWQGKNGAPQKPSYAGFRMYVDNLDAVLPMRDALKRKGIDAYTFAREVETIRHLKQALTVTTALVGGVTLAGMAFSLASLAVANVRRKARFFAQGHLMGLHRRELLCLPLLQMTFVALLAASCSLLFYGCASAMLDLAAAPWLEKGESACRLPATQILLLYAASLVLACLCGTAAGRHLLTMQPAEVLRHDA